MTYRVRVLARAGRDVEAIVEWIAEYSPDGAEQWINRFEEALARLERNPFVAPLAPESEELEEDVRNLLFRTRAGRTYRALFLVVDQEVRVLRVRGPGQPPMTRGDMDT